MPGGAELPLGGSETQLGDYEVLGVIARGGMGVVYKARHRKLNRVVALKLIRSARIDRQAQRFQAEAEAAAKLDHPHIVPVYEVGEVDGRQFIAMAFIDGASLGARVRRRPARRGRPRLGFARWPGPSPTPTPTASSTAT